MDRSFAKQLGDNPTDAKQRTEALERDGYRAIRFWNNDVLDNLEGVFQMIEEAPSEKDPSPSCC